MRIIRYLRQNYLVTLGAWLAACLITLGAGAWGDRTAFALFLGAILVSAFFEGLKGGIVATALAVLCLLAQYQLILPNRQGSGGVDFFLGLALLAGVGVLAAYLSGECRGAVRMAGHFQNTLSRLHKDHEQRKEQCRDLGSRLTEQEQIAEALRQGQQEQESRSTEQIAALEKARGELHDQLQEERTAGASLRRDHGQQQNAWQKTEETLQQRLAELSKAHEFLQQQLADHRTTSEALRREHAQHQDTWKKVDETQQQRLAELTRAHEFLQGQLAERRGVEETLRREQAQHQDASRQTEDNCRRRIDALTEANQDLQDQLAQRQEAVEELHRELAQHRATWKQTELDLHRRIDDLTMSHQSLQQQLGERQAAEEALRHDQAASQDAWTRTEEKRRQEITELVAAKNHLEQELTALRQRETEWCSELEKAQADRRQAAEEIQELHADHRARAEALQEQAGILQADLRATDGLLDHVTDRLRPLLAQARQALATLPTEWPEDPTLRETIAGLDQPVQRCLLHVNAVWAAQHIGRGDLPMHRERMEAHTVIDRALEACGSSLRARRHQVTLALPLGPEWLLGDADLLGQALAALLDNASRYTEPGGDIRLTAERHAEEIVFRVEDNGRGIPAADLPRFLQRCARNRCFADGRAEGLGLGLALARSLVEGHGGRLSAASREPERGSAFALHLPACPANLTTEPDRDRAALKLIPFRPAILA